MALLKLVSKVLLLTTGFSSTDAFKIWEVMYKAELCYFLDGVLAVFGLVITAMYIHEKYFEGKNDPKPEEGIYEDLKGQDTAGYAPLKVRKGDPEAGKRRPEKRPEKGPERGADDTYTTLKPRECEYKELPMKKERRRRPEHGEQVYQGLSLVTKDTYDSLKPAAPPRKAP